MSGRNLESYLEDASAFDALSDEDKARLFAGDSLEGETNTNAATDADPLQAKVEENSEAPAADPVVTQEDKQAVTDPVVLAKDGQHTIPFSELEAARERARLLEQEVQTLKAGKVEQPQAAAPVVPSVPAVDEALIALVKERDEALYTGDTEGAHQLSMKIIGIQQAQATQAAIAAMDARDSQKKEQESQANMLSDAKARADALTDKYPFLDQKNPAVNQDAIDLVVARRDQLMSQGVPFADAIEQAVAKVAPLFSKGSTNPIDADVAAKAAQAISKAKAQVPTSLSQVPAGAAAHHDEGEAIRSKSGMNLLDTFAGKSSEEILKLMSRVI